MTGKDENKNAVDEGVKNSAENEGGTKSAENEDETKNAENEDETKSAENNGNKDETKSAENNGNEDGTKSAEHEDETKSAENEDETNSAENEDETKSAENENETKSAENGDEAKSAENEDERKNAEDEDETNRSALKEGENKSAENGHENKSAKYVGDEKKSAVICDEGDPGPGETQDEGCCMKIGGWFRSVNFYVYCSRSLSTWGDRMWKFAVGLFLVDLAGNSLQLTAIYGLSSGGTILLFGALVGDWVDRNPRLKVALVTLIIQNLSIIICAVVLCLMLIYPVAMVTVWNGWLGTLCKFLVILFADIADLASVGHTISIERDWVVEICGRDSKTLTTMTAAVRRIYLAAGILAPTVTGQIMSFGSLLIGAIFIAAWNIVSFFLEYYLLWKVYYLVPALAVKEKNEMPTPRQKRKQDTTSSTEQIVQCEQVMHTSTDDIETIQPRRSHKPCLRIFSQFITLYQGWRCYMRQSICLAGLALASLYLTVLGFDDIFVGYAYSQGMSESLVGALMGVGGLTGIAGTFCFLCFRGTFGLVKTGVISLSLQTLCIAVCVTSIWAPGSPFDPTFSRTNPSKNVINCNDQLKNLSNHGSNNRHNLPETFSNFTNVTGSDMDNLTDSRNVTWSSSGNGLGDTVNWTCSNATPGTPPFEKSFLSLALIMGGVIGGRFGLWGADLTITQLTLETVEENERGTVNGVQSSLNMLMDMVKYTLVIAAPDPETYGILILISFTFVSLGLVLYIIFYRRFKGDIDEHPYDFVIIYTLFAP